MTDNENKELFKAAAQEAEELHGVSLAEIMSNPDKYDLDLDEFHRSSDGASVAEVVKRFDEPSSNAIMCASAEMVDCGVFGCSAKVSTEEAYDYNDTTYCEKHDPEEWDKVITATFGRQNYKEMGHDAWLLSPEQAQQLSGASDERMIEHQPHPEFEPEFWLIQIDDGADFWCAISESGTDAKLFDVVVRFWCEENEGTTCETLENRESLLTVQRVLDFCSIERIKKELEDTKEELRRLQKFHSEIVLGIYAFLEDSEASPRGGE